ncbi:MAG: Rpn family recombination-promoting nuclease/putative transposase, partial [Cyanobacteria bacterium P01_A01_bin.137]
DRSVYYSTFPIQAQAEQGDWNYKLSAVYTVGILDFIFDDHKTDPTIKHVIELKNQRCEVFFDKLKFIYIELPKFTKTLDQLDSHYDKWLFLLKHLYRLEEKPEILQGGIFNRLFEVAEIDSFSRVERQDYESSLKYYRDLQNVVDTSRQKGRAEGRVEGRAEGRAEERQTVAIKLLRENVPLDVISRTTALSVETLEELQQQLS